MPVTPTITPAVIKVGFTTTLDDPTIQTYIDAATEEVFARLEVNGIDPDALPSPTPRTIRLAIIDLTRCKILGVDLGARVSTASNIKSIQEGSEKITFGSQTATAAAVTDPCLMWVVKVDAYIGKNAPGRQPMIGAVTRRVGHTINDDGLSKDPEWER